MKRFTVRKCRPHSPLCPYYAVYDAEDAGQMVPGLGRMTELQARAEAARLEVERPPVLVPGPWIFHSA